MLIREPVFGSELSEYARLRCAMIERIVELRVMEHHSKNVAARRLYRYMAHAVRCVLKRTARRVDFATDNINRRHGFREYAKKSDFDDGKIVRYGSGSYTVTL